MTGLHPADDSGDSLHRTVTIDTTDGSRTCIIIDHPFAEEWPAGDPVPGDKENLGYVRRVHE